MKTPPPKKIRSASVFPGHDLPVAVLRMPDHGNSAPHSHDFHELVLITRGAGLHTTEHGDCPLKAGDAFWIGGNTRHGYASADRLALVNILFHPRLARLPLDELDLGAVPGYHALFRIGPGMRQPGRGLRLGLNAAQLEQALAIVAELESEVVARRPGACFMACGHLMRLIGFLARCYSAPQEPRGTPAPGISRALVHIDRHHAEHLTIAQLARVAGMSESTFMRRFRDAVGRPPSDYVIHTRIARACEKLRRDDGSKLAAVADACGFSDANYFSRLFRRVMGCTPRAYRSLAAPQNAGGSGAKENNSPVS